MKQVLVKRWSVWLILAVALSACQVEIVPAAPVAPEVWRVQVSPTLRVLGPAFNECIQQLPGKTLLYDEQPLSAMDPAKADFTLGVEPVAGAGYTAIVGHTALAVVVNPSNPFSQISWGSLEAIFSGKALAWSDLAATDCPGCAVAQLKAIQPYVYAEGDDLGQVVHGLLPGTSYRLANGLLAPNPGAVREAVADDPQAVGIVPSVWLDQSVKSLKISDLPAGNLQIPIILSAAVEPAGARLSWLLCLQEKLH